MDLFLLQYIYYHLHENVNGTILAEITGLNRSYLSTLFHKETGMTISDYIMSKKMEATENMLKYSDFSYLDISLAKSCCAFYAGVIADWTEEKLAY